MCNHVSKKYLVIFSLMLFMVQSAHASQFSTAAVKAYLKNTIKTKVAPSSPAAKIGAGLLNSIQADAKTYHHLSKNLQGAIAVQIVAYSGSDNALINSLHNMGIEVKNRINHSLYAFVQPKDIHRIAGMGAVKSINMQPTLALGNTDEVANLMQAIGINQPTEQPIPQYDTHPPINQDYVPAKLRPDDLGFQAIHASRLHQKHIYGEGLTIGIIDFGFNSYPHLQHAGLVPMPSQVKTFYAGNSLATLTTDTGTPHGTAVAEIIYNLAPKANYVIAQVGNGKGQALNVDLLNAIDWMASQGVNIINFSGGGHSEPHNGMADTDNKVNDIVKKHGILWVSAAGNEATKHWGGNIADENNNAIVDMNGNDILKIKANGSVRILVNWDDWGDTSPSDHIDIDIFVIDKQGNIMAKNTTQRGIGTAARDVLYANLPKGDYAIALVTNKASTKKVHVYVDGAAKLIDYNPSGSISIPATAHEALAVAAWDVHKKRISYYSSQGYTDDDRLKPEISAPTGVYSHAYDDASHGKSKQFIGTSAATPYATGFAALIWSQHPTWSVAKLRHYMQQSTTRKLGLSSPNPSAGYGLLDARKILGLAPVTVGHPNQQPLNQPQRGSRMALQPLLDDLGIAQ